MVASVLRARLKQELLSLPEAAFTVGMKLRCEGVIENVSTKLIERRSEATVNILAKSVSVASASLSLKFDLGIIAVKNDQIFAGDFDRPDEHVALTSPNDGLGYLILFGVGAERVFSGRCAEQR